MAPDKRRRVRNYILLVTIGALVYLTFNAVTIPSKQPLKRREAPAIKESAEALSDPLAKAVQFYTNSSDMARYDSQFAKLKEHLKCTFQRVHQTGKDAPIRCETLGGGNLLTGSEPGSGKKAEARSLLYTWKGTRAETGRRLKPVLLISHLDVVPARKEDGWSRDPIGGEIFADLAEKNAPRYLYGRGTLDDKLGVVGILQAAELILRDEPRYRPERTIYFGFGQDEEVSGDGARAIARALACRESKRTYEEWQRVKSPPRAAEDRPIACVVDEGTAVVSDMISFLPKKKSVAPIGVVEKGYVNIMLTVEQPGGHSSVAPPQTAIGILNAAVARVERSPFPSRMPSVTAETLRTLGPEVSFDMRFIFANLNVFDEVVRAQLAATPELNAMIRTTAAPTLQAAGIKDNILPRIATTTINCRVLPDEDLAPEAAVEAVRRRIEQVIDDDRVQVRVDPQNRFPPSRQSRTNCPAFRALGQVIVDVFPDAVVIPFIVTAGTDARNYEPIADNVYRFLPVRLTSKDLDRIHGVDERIAVDGYKETVTFYYHLIKTLGGDFEKDFESP